MLRSAPVLALADELPRLLAHKLRPPVGIVLGSPREAAELVAALKLPDVVCIQMDLYQAERLRSELAERKLSAQVATVADVWDVTASLQTLLYPAALGGERALKLDMIEQGYHALRPQGTFIVLSPYDTEQLFPQHLKKVFGKVHMPASAAGVVLWCQRGDDRPRRRHEMTFHVRRADQPSLRFVSRPGTFSYGRFDDGARALVETMLINPGDRVLDLGCGCGTNGILAGLEAQGEVVFVDSNPRAIALTELNAAANGLTTYRTVASAEVEVADAPFDVVLANPPYFAQQRIAEMFITRGHALLRPGGRFYLVTKQPQHIAPFMEAAFGTAETVVQRGYSVFYAERE